LNQASQAFQLDELEKEMLAGGKGAAAQRAIRLLLRYGQIVGANSFVPVAGAHIDGCLYHGASSIDFAESFASVGARVSVPTTLNVGAVDVTDPALNMGDRSLVHLQLQLTQAYVRMGCVPSLTCAPYQRRHRPRRGEHIAWAESNAIVFANSVLGARTERYGDFVDLCAAITGRAPLSGLHRDENRRARVVIEVVDVARSGLDRDVYFGCVGFCVGQRVGSRVPALLGLPADTNEDELKALGAAAASGGEVAMFHAVALTPEAKTLQQALGDATQDVECISLTAEALRDAAARLCPIEAGEPLSAVCLGTPHFSLTEFERLAHLVSGKHTSVEFYVSTSREIAAELRSRPWYPALTDFGARIVLDTCTYLAPVIRRKEGAVLTNSAKWAFYGPGNLRRRAGLTSLENCIRSAISGFVVR